MSRSLPGVDGPMQALFQSPVPRDSIGGVALLPDHRARIGVDPDPSSPRPGSRPVEVSEQIFVSG